MPAPCSSQHRLVAAAALLPTRPANAAGQRGRPTRPANAAGQRRVAENVLPRLEKLLAQDQ